MSIALRVRRAPPAARLRAATASGPVSFYETGVDRDRFL